MTLLLGCEASKSILALHHSRAFRSGSVCGQTMTMSNPEPAQSQQPPSDADIDRALDEMEKFLRRFLGVIRDEKPDRT